MDAGRYQLAEFGLDACASPFLPLRLIERTALEGSTATARRVIRLDNIRDLHWTVNQSYFLDSVLAAFSSDHNFLTRRWTCLLAQSNFLRKQQTCPMTSRNSVRFECMKMSMAKALTTCINYASKSGFACRAVKLAESILESKKSGSAQLWIGSAIVDDPRTDAAGPGPIRADSLSTSRASRVQGHIEASNLHEEVSQWAGRCGKR